MSRDQLIVACTRVDAVFKLIHLKKYQIATVESCIAGNVELDVVVKDGSPGGSQQATIAQRNRGTKRIVGIRAQSPGSLRNVGCECTWV